jgi:hypothetical protein
MIRRSVGRRAEQDPNFAWRGDDVSRIENLSDIVFALTLGMIVSAASVPVTFGDLLSYLLGIIPAAAGFFIVLVIWNTHYLFFRRYDLRDSVITKLNAVLLLFVLFIAYPLRFSFDAFFAWSMAMMGDMERADRMQVSHERAGAIVAIFWGGYAAVFTVFLLMYRHARRRADDIGLTPSEKVLTDQKIWQMSAAILLASLIVPMAVFTPAGGFVGFAFLLIWPINWLLHKRFDRRAEKAATLGATAEGSSFDGQKANPDRHEESRAEAKAGGQAAR